MLLVFLVRFKRLTVQRINATVLGRQFRVTFSKSTAFKRSWSFWILMEMRKCKSTWGPSFIVVGFLVFSMHSHWKTSLRLQIIDEVRSAVNAHDKFGWNSWGQQYGSVSTIYWWLSDNNFLFCSGRMNTFWNRSHLIRKFNFRLYTGKSNIDESSRRKKLWARAYGPVGWQHPCKLMQFYKQRFSNNNCVTSGVFNFHFPATWYEKYATNIHK